MKYDDSTWHSEGDFPADLPPEAGATHIGMFMAWALANDLGSEETADYRADVMAQRGTPGGLLLEHCDGQITDEDLNDLGNRFAAHYYSVGDNIYYDDLAAIVGKRIYHMDDSWETLRRIEPKLTERLAAFTKGG